MIMLTNVFPIQVFSNLMWIIWMCNELNDGMRIDSIKHGYDMKSDSIMYSPNSIDINTTIPVKCEQTIIY